MCQATPSCVGFTHDGTNCVLHSDWGNSTATTGTNLYLVTGTAQNRNYIQAIPNFIFTTSVDPYLLLWYTFKDTVSTGTTVLNSGGLGSMNNGTLNGGMTATMLVSSGTVKATGGTVGNVLNLTKGSNQYMSIGLLLFGGSSFTLCFWFKRDVVGTDNWPRIIDFGNGSTALQNMVLAISTASSNNGYIMFSLGETGTWGTTYYLTTSSVCDNTWRHIALVCTFGSQTSSTYVPYVNGVAGTSFTTAAPSANVRANNYIGGRNDTPSCFKCSYCMHSSFFYAMLFVFV